MVFESPQSELGLKVMAETRKYDQTRYNEVGSDPPPTGDGPLPTSTGVITWGRPVPK